MAETLERLFAGGAMCCGTFLLFGVIATIVGEIRDSHWLRVFLRDHAGRTFFIASRRRLWFDFLRNNVLPILPAGTEVVWLSARFTPVERALRLRLKGFSPRYPILVLVTSKTLAYASLHEQLFPLKPSAYSDDAVRAQTRAIIESALVRLQNDMAAKR